MNEHPEDIEVVKETINKERTNLFTVISALSFLCVCLIITNLSMASIAANLVNERDAVAIALDDQRSQYYYCIRDYESTAMCDEDLVSPASRNILRDLTGSGFGDLLYDDESVTDPLPDVPDGEGDRETFGLLGYIVYGDSE